MLHISVTYARMVKHTLRYPSMYPDAVGVYVEEGPDRDALTAALAKENYLPVYLDPRTVQHTPWPPPQHKH